MRRSVDGGVRSRVWNRAGAARLPGLLAPWLVVLVVKPCLLLLDRVPLGSTRKVLGHGGGVSKKELLLGRWLRWWWWWWCRGGG